MPIFIPQSFKGEIMSDYYKDPEHDDYDDDDYRNYPQEYNEYGYPKSCLLYTSPSPRDMRRSRMPSSA